jgi:hypothetical protein
MRRLFVSITLAIAAATSATAQETTPPFSAYLMNEARETALARSAAPESVTAGAGIHLLRAHGYELVTPSQNGFHCLVQRSFTVPSSNAAEFYDPRVVAPICFAPDAAATVMQRDLLIAPLVARGMPLSEIRTTEADAYASGALTYPESAVFAYMLSTEHWLGPGITHWRPHVMVWAPGVDARDLLPEGLSTFGLESGMPVLDTRYGPRQTLIVIPVGPSSVARPRTP